jgi:hypothetical protein
MRSALVAKANIGYQIHRWQEGVLAMFPGGKEKWIIPGIVTALAVALKRPFPGPFPTARSKKSL